MDTQLNLDIVEEGFYSDLPALLYSVQKQLIPYNYILCVCADKTKQNKISE